MKYDSVLDQQSISGKIVSLILCVWKPCYMKSGHIYIINTYVDYGTCSYYIRTVKLYTYGIRYIPYSHGTNISPYVYGIYCTRMVCTVCIRYNIHLRYGTVILFCFYQPLYSIVFEEQCKKHLYEQSTHYGN